MRSLDSIRFWVLVAAVLMVKLSAASAAELGDVNGDGRVSPSDGFLLTRWFATRLELLEPKPGALDETGELAACSFGQQDTHATFVFMEGLRRSVSSPLPHFVDPWPGAPSDLGPAPNPDPAVRLRIVPQEYDGESGRIVLAIVLTNEIPLDFICIGLRSPTLDLRPEHPTARWSTGDGNLIASTHYYLLTRGDYVAHSDCLTLGTPQTFQPGEHTLAVEMTIQSGASAGSHKIHWSGATEAVSAFHDVIRPVTGPGEISLTRPAVGGHSQRFPDLELADGERGVAGTTRIRVLPAQAFPGETFRTKIQLNTDRPINGLGCLLVFDSRFLALIRVTPQYIDSETGTVHPNDHSAVFVNKTVQNDAGGFLVYEFKPGLTQQQSHSPYRFPPSTLQYIEPLSTWVDLIELEFELSERAVGRSPVHVEFYAENREKDSIQRYAVYTPYVSATGIASNAPGCENAAWWKYSNTTWEDGAITVLGGGDPPPEPEPPLDPEIANIRSYIGESFPVVDDEIPDTVPVHGSPGEEVRLPVFLLTDVNIFKTRLVFSFDTNVLSLTGFLVNFLDFDGRPFTELATYDDPLKINLLRVQGKGLVGFFPFAAFLYGPKDSVPDGTVFVDIETTRWWAAPKAQEAWEPGKLYELGHCIFRIRDDAPAGDTSIRGTEIRYKPLQRHYSPVFIDVVSSGYLLLDSIEEERTADRLDVPHILVRQGVVKVLGSEAESLFIRGDSNSDSTVDLSDAINILNALFLGTGLIACADAADTQDDGVINISDTVYLLSHLFTGGPAPPAPYPEPGTDSTEDDLLCIPEERF